MSTAADYLNALNQKRTDTSEGSANAYLKRYYERNKENLDTDQIKHARELGVTSTSLPTTQTYTAPQTYGAATYTDETSAENDINLRSNNIDAWSQYLKDLEDNVTKAEERLAWTGSADDYTSYTAAVDAYNNALKTAQSESASLEELQRLYTEAYKTSHPDYEKNLRRAELLEGVGSWDENDNYSLSADFDTIAGLAEKADNETDAQLYIDLIENYSQPTTVEQQARAQAIIDAQIERLKADGYEEKWVSTGYTNTKEMVAKRQDEIDTLEALKNTLSTTAATTRYNNAYQAVLDELPQELRTEIMALPAALDELETYTKAAAQNGYADSNYTGDALAKEQSLRIRLSDLGYSKDQVNGMIEYAKQTFNASRAEKEYSETEEAAQKNSVFGNWISNVLLGVAQAGELVGLTAQTAAKGIQGADIYTGEKTPVDYNVARIYNMNEAVMSAQQKKFMDKYLAEFDDEEQARIKANTAMNAYQLAVSMGESVINMGLTAAGVPMSSLLLGSSAGVSTIMEYKENGATDGEALAMGLVDAAAEYFTEKYSVEAFFSMKDLGAKKGLEKVLAAAGNIARQAASEGSEEVSSDIFSLLGDTIISQITGREGEIESEYNTLFKSYLSEGMTTAEAEKQACKDVMKGLWEDAKQSFWGGAVSGMLFGVGGNLISDVRSDVTDIQRGKAVKKGDYASFEKLANDLNMSMGENPSNLKVGRTLTQVETGVTDKAIQTRLTELGEKYSGKESALTEAIKATATGQRLSTKEKRALNASKYGQQVAEELTDAIEGNVTEENQWAENAEVKSWLTERIATAEREYEGNNFEEGYTAPAGVDSRTYGEIPEALSEYGNTEDLTEEQWDAYNATQEAQRAQQTEQTEEQTETEKRAGEDYESYVRGLMKEMTYSKANEIKKDENLRAAWENITGQTLSGNSKKMTKQIMDGSAAMLNAEEYVKGLMRDMDAEAAAEIFENPQYRSIWERITGKKAESARDIQRGVMEQDTNEVVWWEEEDLPSEGELPELRDALMSRNNVDISTEQGNIKAAIGESKGTWTAYASLDQGQAITSEGATRAEAIDNLIKEITNYAESGRESGTGESGIRQNGFDSGIEAGRVGSGTEENSRDRGASEGGNRENPVDRRAAFKDQEKVSPADCGIVGGSDRKEMKALTLGESEETDRLIRNDPVMGSVQRKADLDGNDVTYFIGNLRMKSGVLARGMLTSDGKIYVKVGDTRMTETEIYDHEQGHKIIRTTGLTEDMIRAATSWMSDEEYNQALQQYAEDCYPQKLSTQDVLIEIVCDARAGVGPCGKMKAEVNAAFDRALGEAKGRQNTDTTRMLEALMQEVQNLKNAQTTQQTAQQNTQTAPKQTGVPLTNFEGTLYRQLKSKYEANVNERGFAEGVIEYNALTQPFRISGGDGRYTVTIGEWSTTAATLDDAMRSAAIELNNLQVEAGRKARETAQQTQENAKQPKQKRPRPETTEGNAADQIVRNMTGKQDIGERNETTRNKIQRVLKEVLKSKTLTEEQMDELYDLASQIIISDDSDVLANYKGTRIYVDPKVKAEFGDEWKSFRMRAMGRGITITTTDRTAMGYDSLYSELAAQEPGVFDPEETDPRTMLESMVPQSVTRTVEEMKPGENGSTDYWQDQILDYMQDFTEQNGIETEVEFRGGDWEQQSWMDFYSQNVRNPHDMSFAGPWGRRINLTFSEENGSTTARLERRGVVFAEATAPMEGERGRQLALGRMMNDAMNADYTQEPEIESLGDDELPLSGNRVMEENPTENPVEPETEYKFSRTKDTELMDDAEKENYDKKGNTYAVPPELMETAREQREQVKEIYDAVEDQSMLPKDEIGNTMVANGSYGLSAENSTICPRSLSLDILSREVAEILKRPLTFEENVFINQESMNWTDNPQCIYCYVKADRDMYTQYLSNYLEQRDNAISAHQQGMSIGEVLETVLGIKPAAEGKTNKRDNKTVRKRIQGWFDLADSGKPMLTAEDLAGVLNEKENQETRRAQLDPAKRAEFDTATAYAQSAARSKLRFKYAAYGGNILNFSKNKVNKLNTMFGLRMYSFTDFSPAFILENMQMFTDAAVKGLKVLAYTKDARFVEIFGGTGANISMSVFCMSTPDANGDYHQDGMQGMDWDTAKALRDKYDGAGITMVCTSDEQVKWAMKQDWVDVVIPYHSVFGGGQILAKLFGWKNYQQMQGDQSIKGIKPTGKEVYPSQHQNDLIEYVKGLEEIHRSPRFPQFLEGYEAYKAGNITEEQFREKNLYYMKLVNETRRAAGDTPAVMPIFNTENVQQMVDEMVARGGYEEKIGYNEEGARAAAEEIVEKGNAAGWKFTPNKASGNNVDEEPVQKFSYAGTNSRTAERGLLQSAQTMEENGMDAEEIRQETGWFRGDDGNWRYEIDDSKVTMNHSEEMEERLYYDDVFLPELLNAPDLYEAYPELLDVKVYINPNSQNSSTLAYFDIENNLIGFNESGWNSEGILDTMIHEIQHAIQSYEQHANGASPEYWESKVSATELPIDMQAIKALKTELEEYLWDDVGLDAKVKSLMLAKNGELKGQPELWQQRKQELLDEYGEDISDYLDAAEKYYDALEENRAYRKKEGLDLYFRTAGEIEAYDAESRRTLSAEERENKRPNVGSADVVFAEDGTRSYSEAKDSEGNTLSDPQSDYFKNSEIRDRNGNLQVVYHGTDSDFTVFDRKYLGQNTDEYASDPSLAATAHIGFWFNSKNIAREQSNAFYSNSMKGYLNIENPLIVYNLEELQEMILDHNDGIVDDFDLEYGTNEEISGILGNQFVTWMKSEGYDGIVVEHDEEFGGTSYVTLESNQFKNADNLTPTTDRDIRYSGNGVEEDTNPIDESVDIPRLPKNEAQSLAEQQNYPVLMREDGSYERAVPGWTWVRTADRGNYGYVSGAKGGMLEVTFVNKANDISYTPSELFAPGQLTAVDAEYQGERAPLEEEAPPEVEPVMDELTDEEFEQIMREEEDRMAGKSTAQRIVAEGEINENEESPTKLVKEALDDEPSLMDVDLAGDPELYDFILRAKHGKGGNYNKTIDQNMDDAFERKEDRKLAEERIVKPVHDAAGAYAKEVEKRKSDLYRKMKSLGITEDMAENRAIVWYGEGVKQGEGSGLPPETTAEYTPEDLKAEFPNTWKQVKEAAEYMRFVYDDMLKAQNASRSKVYPNIVEKAQAKIAQHKVIEERYRAASSEQVRIFSNLRDEINRVQATIDRTENSAARAALESRLVDLQAAADTARDASDRYETQAARARSISARLQAQIDSGEITRGKYITPRKDYFHHGKEMATGMEGLINTLTTSADISSNLAGMSEFTKPKSKWQGHFQRRNDAIYYNANAIGDMLSYIDAAAYVTNIDPAIARLRQQVSYMAQITEKSRNANQMLTWMIDYINQLAGKTNPMDRFITTKLVGRKALKVMKWVNGRVKNNAVMANARSAVAQFFNLQNATMLLKNPSDWAAGCESMMQWLTGDESARAVMASSDFMTSRFGVGKAENLFETSKLNKAADYMMRFGDEAVARLAWWTAYERALNTNENDPIYYADDIVRRAVAGRGIGEVPLVQDSEVTKFFAPFQVEVNNTFQLVKRKVKEKDFGALALFALVAYLMNEPLREHFGFDVSWDPINAALEAAEAAQEEDTAWGKISTIGGRLAGEVASNAAYGSQLVSLLVSDETTREEIFGDSDPTRYGVGNIGINMVTDPIIDLINGDEASEDLLSAVLNIALPYGGKQAGRIIDTLQTYGVLPEVSISTEDGISAYRQQGGGAAYSSGGNLKYAPESTWDNWVRSLLFGNYATKEGMEYLESGSVMSEDMTNTFRSLTEQGVSTTKAAEIVKGLNDITKTKTGEKRKTGERQTEAINFLAASGLTQEQQESLYYDRVASDAQQLDIDALRATGMDWRDISDALTTYYALEQDESLSATQKATQLASWAMSNLTLTQSQAVRQNLTYSSGFTASTNSFDAYVDNGVDPAKASEVVMRFGQLTPENGRDQVTDEQKMYSLSTATFLTEDDRYAITGAMLGTELETESGSPSQYAKMLTIQRAGVSYDDYIDLKMADKTADKAQVLRSVDATDEEKLAVAGTFVTDSQYWYLSHLQGYGVNVNVWADFLAVLPYYDADGNGSYKQAEVTAALTAMNLDDEQKAALWQMQTGGSKNPFDAAIGKKISSAYKAR